MERKVLGRVRGSMWYQGAGITGVSTEPTIFSESGVTKAYENDIYLNVSQTENRGNVYFCTTPGDELTAEWAYAGTIIGPLPDVIDNLESQSTEYALSARQGSVLKGLIDNAGIFAKIIMPDSTVPTATVSMVIENKTSTITIMDMDGNSGTYSFTQGTGTADRTVTFTIGDIMTDTSAVIRGISSSAAAIKSYTLYDLNGDVIKTEIPNIWEQIARNSLQLSPEGTITDGNDTIRTAYGMKMLDGEPVVMMPISHAKAIWFSRAENKTIYDILGDLMTLAGEIENNLFCASITGDDGIIIVDDDGTEIAGDWKYKII